MEEQMILWQVVGKLSSSDIIVFLGIAFDTYINL